MLNPQFWAQVPQFWWHSLIMKGNFMGNQSFYMFSLANLWGFLGSMSIFNELGMMPHWHLPIFFWERLFFPPAGSSFQSGSSRSTWVHLGPPVQPRSSGMMATWNDGYFPDWGPVLWPPAPAPCRILKSASVQSLLFRGNIYGIFEHQSE